MKQFVGLLTFLFFSFGLNAKNYEVTSPNSSVNIEVNIDKEITWSAFKDNKKVLSESQIALELSNEVLGVDPKVAKAFSSEVNTITEAVVPYKFKNVVDHCNELVLNFKGNYTLRFRAYDNGVSYRWELNKKGEVEIINEVADLNFGGECTVLFPEEISFYSHFERLYVDTILSGLSTERFSSLPALVNLDDELKIGITETGQNNYPALFLQGTGSNALTSIFPKVPLKLEQTRDRSEKIVEEAAYIAKIPGKFSLPWRVLMIEKEDRKLIENNLPYILADHNVLESTDWIKPGKVAWDWWNANNIYGVDFKSGVNTETYKYFIDFASEFGIEYIILDEGWSETTNLLKFMPDMDVHEIIEYGKSKNVDVILWVLWKPLLDNLEATLDEFKKWGAVGVKVDFMQRADQLMVNYYEQIAKAAAEREFLVDFHGAFKPNGLQRKYPNVVNYEGLRGAEHNKWADYITPAHNLTLPFTRMLAGPMDYTPGATVNKDTLGFRDVFNAPMSQGTRAHQAGMYVLYESPIQMFCDNPSNYWREPGFMKFMVQIPTTWDRTVALEGKVKEYLVVARKNGDNWYIGGMNDWTPREFNIDLSFLGKGEWEIEYLADGVNADMHQSDYVIKKEIITGTKLQISMASGGGYLAILKKIK